MLPTLRNRNSMNSLWNDFPSFFNSANLGSEMSNIEDQDNQFVITKEIGGLNKDNTHIELKRGNVLRLYGEKTIGSRTKRFQYEFFLGDYEDIDTENIEASYENGVLELVIPKNVEKVQKEIPVVFK